MRETKPFESRIPEFATTAEEAAFWDAHELTEFEDELEEVDVQFVRPGSDELSITLDKEDLKQLRQTAKARKTRVTSLAKRWILEGLARDTAAKQP